MLHIQHETVQLEKGCDFSKPSRENTQKTAPTDDIRLLFLDSQTIVGSGEGREREKNSQVNSQKQSSEANVSGYLDRSARPWHWCAKPTNPVKVGQLLVLAPDLKEKNNVTLGFVLPETGQQRLRWHTLSSEGEDRTSQPRSAQVRNPPASFKLFRRQTPRSPPCCHVTFWVASVALGHVSRLARCKQISVLQNGTTVWR